MKFGNSLDTTPSKRSWRGFQFAALWLLLGAIGACATPEKDSVLFAHRFDGSGIWSNAFVSGWAEENGAGAAETLDGTVLNYDHGGAGTATVLDGTASSTDGGATTWADGNDGDWTMEVGLRFNALANGFALWVGTGTHRVIVEIHADRTQDMSTNTFQVAHDNLDGRYHVFRVANDATNGTYRVWRDGVLLTPTGVVYDAAAPDERLLCGDYTAGPFGDGFNVDIAYVRYDQTGAYAPPAAPDPARLYAWYKGDAGVVKTDGQVRTWENQAASAGANDRHLDRTEGSPRTLEIGTTNGFRNVIRLDGNAALWSAAGDFGSLDAAKTLCLAVRVNDEQDGFLFDGATATGMSRAQLVGGAWQTGVQPPPIDNASNQDAVTGPARIGTWQVHTFTFSESGGETVIQHDRDGRPLAQVRDPDTDPLSGLILGMNARALQGLKVDIAEVLVYDAALSPADRAAVETYLHARWAGALTVANRPVKQVLRRMGDDGVHTYRLPGLVTSTDGALIAVFDIRHNSSGDLPGNIDVGMRRSLDNGATWEDTRTIMDFPLDEDPVYGNGVGDPCILVDEVNGRVWVAALWSHGNNGWHGSGPGLDPDDTGQLVLAYSDDHGATWSAPTNITAQVKDPSWRLLLQGPGNGFTARDGTLVLPAQYKDGANVPRACFITSTNRGATWTISNPAVPSGTPATTESQTVELNDGSFMISMRNHAGLGKRAWATTADGGATWSPVWYDLPDPVCMASFIRYSSTLDGADRNRLLFSNPARSSGRYDMTVRMSYDEGGSWTVSRLLDDRPSGYSCLTVLQDGTVGLLYECGDLGSVETLTFARFTIDWLTRSLDPPRPRGTVISVH